MGWRSTYCQGGFYSPNTLQDHIATIHRQWSGIDRASSRSGRRTLATKLLHEQSEHLKTVQKVLGYKSAAITTIYQNVTEQEMKEVLKKSVKTTNTESVNSALIAIPYKQHSVK